MKNIKKCLVILMLISTIFSGCGSNSDDISDNDYNSGITVYVTDSGSKYHKSGCRYLSKSKYEIDLYEAIEEGYEPCKVCDPPTE